MSDPYILAVEDDEAISTLIKFNLEKEGYIVDQAFDGNQAMDFIERAKPDLIILDWMLPNMSGIEIAKEVRSYDATKDIPIIMLTAKVQEDDKLQGFDSGIDDYMTKPFSPKELVARIKSVLKRVNPQLVSHNSSYGGIEVDNVKKCILVNGTKLNLSPKEFKLLAFMVEKPERVHSRDSIMINVWDDEENIESRAIDVCVRRIRANLEKTSPGLENIVQTVRGEGYILEKE